VQRETPEQTWRNGSWAERDDYWPIDDEWGHVISFNYSMPH
jgi:hypothetical protein